ncbi:MAG: HIT family protein [Nannocystaceae bacterium]|nr:HIT family protein [Myxococcales bacterium]
MPTLITRAEALRRIEEEGGKPRCLMCAIRDRAVGAVHAVFEDDELLVMLPRYVRRWGHLMVMPKAHATRYDQVDAALWTRVSQRSLQAARVVERVMRPLRCYMASTGSSAGELTQSSEHLHVHVVPLYQADDKPSDIFSWQGGVYVGAPAEWAALTRRYRAAWDQCWP